MKIAICISGAPRHIEQSLQTVSFIKTLGDVKVFIHTWSTDSNISVVENVSWRPRDYTKTSTYKDVVNNFSFEKLKLDCLNTCTSYIKAYKEKNNITIAQYPDALAPYCMLYSMQQVEKLKSEYEAEHSLEFDIVYRMRFDNCVITPNLLPTTKYEAETLIIPQTFVCGHPQINSSEDINDQFAYGTSLLMSKYLNAFYVLPFLNIKTYHNTEALLKNCIKTQNIPYTVNTDVQVILKE